ncbi:MAG: winged helix-turn-helix domain-containing protein [Casimicrobiaceae bacterium]
MNPDVYFHIREGKRGAGLAVGPGKVALLEAIAQTGSITAAAKLLGMSYRRAWLLVEQTNACLISPAVETATGGSNGGGTKLTPAGSELISRYRALERETRAAVAARLNPIMRPLR